ncbi:hypothetical protein AAFF_G00145670 [Aldrovandia affinis]|uniref:Uncharacterized protein n=1 Tax=Aldrovandia affinis TaxID=143900 RepID=A0AAD7T155_9TELE|nr:hypothetical protein AAFF_G00145670 [Aldrovandia affinis]
MLLIQSYSMKMRRKKGRMSWNLNHRRIKSHHISQMPLSQKRQVKYQCPLAEGRPQTHESKPEPETFGPARQEEGDDNPDLPNRRPSGGRRRTRGQGDQPFLELQQAGFDMMQRELGLLRRSINSRQGAHRDQSYSMKMRRKKGRMSWNLNHSRIKSHHISQMSLSQKRQSKYQCPLAEGRPQTQESELEPETGGPARQEEGDDNPDLPNRRPSGGQRRTRGQGDQPFLELQQARFDMMQRELGLLRRSINSRQGAHRDQMLLMQSYSMKMRWKKRRMIWNLNQRRIKSHHISQMLLSQEQQGPLAECRPQTQESKPEPETFGPARQEEGDDNPDLPNRRPSGGQRQPRGQGDQPFLELQQAGFDTMQRELGLLRRSINSRQGAHRDQF